MNYNEVFKERTKAFALLIIKEVMAIKYDDALGVMRKQFIRCATSVAANYRAVIRARSKRERFAKMCIVVEEADETCFWLEMLHEAKYITTSQFETLSAEANEILKVMSTYRSKLNE